jgi:hypothetical protein
LAGCGQTGLDQNTVFLAGLLQTDGFDVSLILKEDDVSKGKDKFLGINLRKIKNGIEFVKACEDLDVVLFVSSFLGGFEIEYLRKKGVKICHDRLWKLLPNIQRVHGE